MRLFTCFCVSIFVVLCSSKAAASDKTTSTATKLINEHVYSNIFLRHREEQKTLLNHIRSIEDYAQQYKLLKVGLLKILEILETNRAVLASAQYQPSDGFPRTEDTIDAFALILENTCLFGDLVLHTPEMSAKILAKNGSDWRALIGWAATFVEPYFDTIIDEKSREMLSLFDQEINPARRGPDYINPYHSANRKNAAGKDGGTEKAKKERKKLRKGPQLSAAGSNHIEL